MRLYKRIEVEEITGQGVQEICNWNTQIEVYTQLEGKAYYTSKIYNVQDIDMSRTGSMFINLEGSEYNTSIVLHNVVTVEFYSWDNNGDTIKVITNPLVGI